MRIAQPKYDILPNRYYVWTYRPKEYWKMYKYITEYSLYKKHVSSIHYFTRYHAKRTITYYLGVDALSYIHIIKGKNLIKQGITTIPKRYHDKIFFKGKPVRIKQFIVPFEYKVDKHRRRYFRIKAHRIFNCKGKKGFDNFYAIELYGQRESFSHQYQVQKRAEIRKLFLPEI